MLISTSIPVTEDPETLIRLLVLRAIRGPGASADSASLLHEKLSRVAYALTPEAEESLTSTFDERFAYFLARAFTHHWNEGAFRSVCDVLRSLATPKAGYTLRLESVITSEDVISGDLTRPSFQLIME